MTSQRVSYPVLQDRFAEHTMVKLPIQTEWPHIQGLFKCNGWMFISDEWFLYASRNGLNFFPIYYHGGPKIGAAAYGNDVYVFVGESGQILTSEGPDEYMNWNLEEQTPYEGYLYHFIDVCFDGTAFIVCGWTSGGTPYFQYALASDVTTWFEAAGESTGIGWAWETQMCRIRSDGAGKLVSVGSVSGEPVEFEWGTAAVIQVSDDHGETWTNVPYGSVPLPGESSGLTELEYIKDRFVALSSEEEASTEAGSEIIFIQSMDGETWEDISDRLVTPFYWEQHFEEIPEYEHRSALINDRGNVVVLLPGWDLQIGRIGASGPTDFKRAPFSTPVPYSEKGMILFNGNYYIEGDVPWQATEWDTAFIFMFTPHVPPTAADLEWTPHTEYP
jgi:hypothetical protein